MREIVRHTFPFLQVTHMCDGTLLTKIIYGDLHIKRAWQYLQMHLILCTFPIHVTYVTSTNKSHNNGGDTKQKYTVSAYREFLFILVYFFNAFTNMYFRKATGLYVYTYCHGVLHTLSWKRILEFSRAFLHCYCRVLGVITRSGMYTA